MPNREETRNLETIPVGPLGLIPLPSCAEIGDKINYYLVKWRKEREHDHKETITFRGYERDIGGCRRSRGRGGLIPVLFPYQSFILFQFKQYLKRFRNGGRFQRGFPSDIRDRDLHAFKIPAVKPHLGLVHMTC